jgi:hypothetical protein
MSKKPHTSISLKEKIAYTLPLLRDAHKHNNRTLMNDLATALVKDIDRAIATSTEETAEAYKTIKRHISAYLLRSAYIEEEELSLPTGESSEVINRGKTINDHILDGMGRKLSADADVEGLPEEGAGLFQANTPDFEPSHIRDVKLSNDHFQNELDKPAQVCDNNPIDSPFSVKDFATQDLAPNDEYPGVQNLDPSDEQPKNEAPKKMTEDFLIEELEILRKKILAGEMI